MVESVRAVERCLDILLCFTMETPELSMTEIAAQVGLHKSTAHRLLATLESRRFIQRDPYTGMYRLGLRVLRLVYVTLRHDDLIQSATPYLRRLNAQFQENVHLAVLDETSVVYVNIVESHHRVKLAAELGQSLPAHATASGKAILAYLPEDELRRILEKGMPEYTPHTIVSVGPFLADVERIRARGFAVSEEEFESDIHAIAAPVLGAGGRPVASVSIAGPAYRLSRERILEMAPQLLADVGELTHEIQHSDLTGTDLVARAIAATRTAG